jgi:UPF0716 protein FxsA
MVTKLFLLFLIVPVIELYLLVKIGSFFGALPIVAVLVLISFAGVWLVRHQGLQVMNRIRFELTQGRLPAGQLLDGALVLVGGILLIIPGFFTDFLGLFFVIPTTRVFIKRVLVLWLQSRLSRGQAVVHRF